MMDAFFGDRILGSESELKSAIVSSTLRVIPAISFLLLLPFLKHAAEYLRIHVYMPRKVARCMRSQGYSGPSMDWSGNNSMKDVRESLEKASSQRQAQDASQSSISHDIETQVLPVHSALKERYGEKFIFHRYGRTCVSRSDPASMREIFSAKSKEYTISKGTTTFREIFGNNGLFVLEDEAWSRQRRLMRPAFYAGRAKDMVPQMATWIDSWLQNLEMQVNRAGAEKNGRVDIDMAVPVGNLTRDILARTSFDSNFEKGRDAFASLQRLLSLVLKRATSSYSLIRWLPNPLEMEIWRLKNHYSKCLQNIVQERRQSAQSTNSSKSYGGSLLDLLLADKAKRSGHGSGGDSGGGGGFLAKRLWLGSRTKDDDEANMMDQFRTIFLAGADTAQSSILWSMVMLAEHGDWQERIRSEIKEALENNALVSGETLTKLPHLDMFVNEVLRLYAPPVQLFREVTQDITSPSRGERLPKSLCVQTNILALHRRKDVWGDDALEFNPWRFSQGISMACKNTPFAYMPFGAGPRICIAQSFVLVEIKLVLLMFLHRFSFRLSPTYRHEPFLLLVLFPKFGVPLIMETLSD